jgi:hypothetical protein
MLHRATGNMSRVLLSLERVAVKRLSSPRADKKATATLSNYRDTDTQIPC